MLNAFERLARQYPHTPCFHLAEADGSLRPVSYADLRLSAVALAQGLAREGVRRGGYVALDMPNCPAFVQMIIAAGYGGFTLVALNHRLSEEEKADRLASVRPSVPGSRMPVFDEGDVDRLVAQGRSALSPTKASHYAERAANQFDRQASALVMFTSGTTGRPKAVLLSWENLCGAAESSNAALGRYGQGLWQLALPLYHVGGFEIVVRSLLGAVPFVLYRRFEAARTLEDAAALGATHLSVVDAMLQDLLDAADGDRERSEALEAYRCILLGGGAPNQGTLKRAAAAGVRVYASYGMTETSSQVASALVTQDFDGGMTMLPGYEARIVAPDGRGVGQLAVRGPGVFERYLGSQAAFTADGLFLTGDTASMADGRIRVLERTHDLFVSGGENIYPAEIREKLLGIPGVTDAYVFGADDERWGKRPVAMVEFPPEDGSSPQARADAVRASAASRLSKLYMPKHICVLDEFPRTGIGKPDRPLLQQLYDERIEIVKADLYRIRQPLKAPFRTAKALIEERESLIVEVTDHRGRTGLGECVSFTTSWYLPETLDQDERVIAEHLIPRVLGQVYLHPREVAAAFAECPGAQAFPLARGAVEPALWDVYGKVIEKPLWRLIRAEAYGQEEADRAAAEGRSRAEALFEPLVPGIDPQITVPAGVVFGIMGIPETLDAVSQAVGIGYPRIKLKVKPGDDLERVRAVREAHPNLTIVLDANQAYTEDDIETLQAIDELGIRCIEEPLDPERPPAGDGRGLLPRLVDLQSFLEAKVCLDESIVTADDAEAALAFPELRCFALKIAKWGGIGQAIAFYRKAQARGIELWMGGMYETAVSKRMHAAFEALPGITLPGDISSTSRYFGVEIAQPPFEVEGGNAVLNGPGYESGLGCELDRAVLERTLVARQSFAREG